MTDDLNTPIRQLRYRLTREDVAAFEFLPRELIGWERLWLFGPILFCGAAAGFFQDSLKSILPWDPTTQLGQLLSVLVAIAIGYLLSLILLTARTRRRIASAQMAEAGIVVDVFPHLFFVTQDGRGTSYAWTGIQVIDTNKHVFLCSNPREATIVPLRAFDNLEGMQEFAKFARARANADEIGQENSGEPREVKT